MAVDLKAITRFVEDNIGEFHAKRLRSLERLKLDAVLKRKNPYLFRAKNIVTAADLVRQLVEAHLSSQEETLFGDFLENLAIHVCELAYGGRKSTTEGIDLEFDLDDIRQIVAIKSGPNWGNASQIKRMQTNFANASRVIRTGNSKRIVQAINGCCYGRDDNPDKGNYQKLCGQRFWSYLSGDEQLYLQIIEPLGHQARQRNDAFAHELARQLNLFTVDFSNRYCQNGLIDWSALVKLGSAALKN